MTPKLSQRTRQLIEIIFPAEQVNEAAQWLEDECGNNLPFCGKYDEYQMERIRFAVIKISKGDVNKLLGAIDEARMDWRDLLMAAEFGYDAEAHEKWAEELLKRE